VYSPSWNASLFTTQDASIAESLKPSNIRTWPSNLDSFRKCGGKIITYHGGQDNQITSFNTERFYKHLSDRHPNNGNTTNKSTQHRVSATSAPSLDLFFRFFRIPGMYHCNSGPGAWVFGELGADSSAGIPFESPFNVLAALIKWVENGTAVEEIIGTKFVNDSVKAGVASRHRHCRYVLWNLKRRSTRTSSPLWSQFLFPPLRMRDTLRRVMLLMDCLIVIGIHCEARTWGQGILDRSPTGLVYSCDIFIEARWQHEEEVGVIIGDQR